MKKILMVFAVLAFVGLSTTTYAQEANSTKETVAEKATNAALGTKTTEKKASCCASKASKASCSKDAKAAKATKVSLNSKASTKKAGASCCASKGKKASCSKAKATTTAQAQATVKKKAPQMQRMLPEKTAPKANLDN